MSELGTKDGVVPHYCITMATTNNLWHSSEEKPNLNRDVLIETDLGGYVVGTYTFPEKHIKRWLYIDDLKEK